MKAMLRKGKECFAKKDLDRLFWYNMGLITLRIYFFMLLSVLAIGLGMTTFVKCPGYFRTISPFMWMWAPFSLLVWIYLSSGFGVETYIRRQRNTHMHLHEKILLYRQFVAFGEKKERLPRRQLTQILIFIVFYLLFVTVAYNLHYLTITDIIHLPAVLVLSSIFSIFITFCFSKYYYLTTEKEIINVAAHITKREREYPSATLPRDKKSRFWYIGGKALNYALLSMVFIETFTCALINREQPCPKYDFAGFIWIFFILFQSSAFFIEFVSKSLEERIIHNITGMTFGPYSKDGPCIYLQLNCILPTLFTCIVFTLYYLHLLPLRDVFFIPAVCIAWITAYLARNYCYSKTIELIQEHETKNSHTCSENECKLYAL